MSSAEHQEVWRTARGLMSSLAKLGHSVAKISFCAGIIRPSNCAETTVSSGLSRAVRYVWAHSFQCSKVFSEWAIAIAVNRFAVSISPDQMATGQRLKVITQQSDCA